jgi:hypothetical protein
MSKKNSFLLAWAVIALFSLARAESGKGIELSEGLMLYPHGYGYLEAGQIGQGHLSYQENVSIGTSDYLINHLWTEDGFASLGFDAVYRNNLEMVASLCTQLYFSYPQFELSGSRYTKNVRQDVSIDDAFSRFHFGDADEPLFLAQIGYFKFKYNPDVRNLGEYMFRTGTYPAYFNMSFDFPQARLLGLHIQDNFFQSLKLDFLLVSSTLTPTMNWSVAALADYDVAKLHFLNIGAGVDFANCFDVYNNTSFPLYFGVNGAGDPTTPRNNNAYYIANGDTNYYTFAGTKLMARFSLDPKVFLPWKVFGENDLKLYAEADLIGVKDYPDSGFANSTASTATLIAPSYNTWWQRMPISFGFNFPTFKTLDVLNAEVEWFGARYYNDASDVINYGSAPLPWDWQGKTSYVNYTKAEIKWSVYAKKTLFGGHWAITGQIGRDHLLLPCAAYDSESWAELLVTAQDWWWVLKTSWMF